MNTEKNILIEKPQEVKGLWSCSCHLFGSFDEAKKAARQKFAIGDKVKNRCTKRTGVVHEIGESHYLIVKYGSRACDLHLEHAQELIKM